MENVKYFLTSIDEIREANKWLSTVNVSNSTGFLRDFNIKVNVRTPRGKELLIDFYFNNKSYYQEFKRALRKLEKS